MEVVYCDNCGFKCAPEAFDDGDAVYGDDGRIYCAKCAPMFQFTTTALHRVKPPRASVGNEITGEYQPIAKSAQSAESPRKQGRFYVCETCGTPLTEDDVHRGSGRDKQAKVYCLTCAAGAKTAEFQAPPKRHSISPPPLPAVPRIPAAASKSPERKGSSHIMPAVQRTSPSQSSRLKIPVVEAQPASKNRTVPVSDRSGPPLIPIFAGAAAAVLFIICLISFNSDSPVRHNKASESTRVANTPLPEKQITPLATPRAVTPTAPPSLPSEPAIVERSRPTHTAPSQPIPAPMESSDEQRAQAAFQQIESKLKTLPAGDTEGRVALLEKFIAEYGSSIVAARAQLKLTALKNPVPSPAPAPVPVIQTTVPVALQPAASPGKEISLDLGSGVKMELMPIPAGEFTMGCDDGNASEKPAHTVKITHLFYMGKFEVTQSAYEAIMGTNPSLLKGENLPVENEVRYTDAEEFCKRMSKKTGKTIRLPTEAEWEYACRAGTTTKYNTGNDEAALSQAGWFRSTSTHPVGQKTPNNWGLYDMHGNVWEWCQDWYSEDYYAKSPFDDPHGPPQGTQRVARGGSWKHGAYDCRVTSRVGFHPESHAVNGGFRVVLEMEVSAENKQK